jgi:putative spermidine/putrescine transport system substrate-binding protein
LPIQRLSITQWKAQSNDGLRTEKETLMKLKNTLAITALGLGTALAAAGTTATVANAKACAKAGELTVVSWGGAYSKSQVEAYHKPFMKDCAGAKIKSQDYNGGIAEIKAQVEGKNVSWDIVDVELHDAVRACDEGLLETIDASTLPKGADGTPAKDDFLKGTIYDCAVASIVWSTIFAYDKTKIKGDAPKTIADFFDLKKWPGKRGMRKSPKINLEFALMAEGVPAKDVYKVLATKAGIDRAFKRLDTIKKSVVWWTAGAQPPQLLADGEVLMTTAYNGRIFNAVAGEGKPFEIVWDGQIWDLDLWVIPKGAKNKDLAMDFLKYSTGTKPLAAQASYISYGPARKSSSPLVGKFHNKDIDMAPQMPTAPKNMTNSVQNNFEFWADNVDQLKERFNAWLAKG